EKSIIDNFETALAKKDFKIYYQPKYAPNTKRLVGAEALIRWQKDDGTIMNPGSFIPIFEQNGMIRILDEYVFRNVCKQQKKWLSEGKNIVPVSINLSRASLYYKNVVEQYKHITQEIDLDRQFVPIEITETAAITNNEIKQIADEFFKEGFSIHMDDFGAGYSSLASLNIMHIETLKLDKSLIDYIGNFGGNRLIEHTISLAKELGIHVTAEGVESEDQVDFLNDVGCDSIQGFFFSKPVPTVEFEKMLSNHSKREKIPSEETIINHISEFKFSLIKRPLYSFVANLTKDYFTEGIGKNNWHKEIQFAEDSYQVATEILTNEYVIPEYKEAYKNMMYRDKLIASYKGINETRLFEYKRKHFDRIAHFRLTIHLFKVSDSPDLWMYFTVTELD
ncbi:MAG: EAL domain-containing protein, partial [Treponema sp.]